MLSLDELEKSANLIRFGVPAVWLQIYRFGHAGTPEYVMASVDLYQPEPKPFDQIDHFKKIDVVHCATGLLGR